MRMPTPPAREDALCGPAAPCVGTRDVPRVPWATQASKLRIAVDAAPRSRDRARPERDQPRGREAEVPRRQLPLAFSVNRFEVFGMEHDVIAIGGSAGGVEALLELVPDLPKDLPASLFVAIHSTPGFPSLLPE